MLKSSMLPDEPIAPHGRPFRGFSNRERLGRPPLHVAADENDL